MQLVEFRLVLRGIHRHPEAIVRVREQLVLLHESAERLRDELFAFLDVVEDLAAEGEEPGVDAQTGLNDVLEALEASAAVERDEVIAQVWLHRDEAADRTTLPERLDLLRQVDVRQAVAV